LFYWLYYAPFIHPKEVNMKFRSTLAAAVILAMTACGEAPAANGKPTPAQGKAASAASKPAEAAAVSNKNVPGRCGKNHHQQAGIALCRPQIESGRNRHHARGRLV